MGLVFRAVITRRATNRPMNVSDEHRVGDPCYIRSPQCQVSMAHVRGIGQAPVSPSMPNLRNLGDDLTLLHSSISEIFDIIVDYPASSAAVSDLKVSVPFTSQCKRCP